MSYTLHITNKNYSSWSLRPWLLLRERGIPFEERLTPFSSDSAVPTSELFRRFSPTGRVPCLVDGDITVWESLAIVEYLAERHPGVWPADATARAWARSVCAEMHAGFSALRGLHSMSCGMRIRVAQRPPALLADIARIEEIWNEGLARFGGPFLAGAEFSAADAFFAPVAFRFQTYGVSVAGPAADYLARLLALPGMRAWEAAALLETGREPGHEDEVLSAGELLADLRAPVARA
ncbi:MAG: glutathione S-transferase family protein [Sulfuritalea sp.]|nr:glutathione S-transferase family protein [Sulfuritalea sp.]